MGRFTFKMRELYRGSSRVAVYKGRNKEPHFIICGAGIGDLCRTKVKEYLFGCDWTDRGSPGWITPQVRCDEFLTERAKRRASHGYED